MNRLRSALVAASLTSLFSSSANARPITLAEALAEAERSPALGAASASVDEARGNLEHAGTYNYNPVLGASAGSVFGAGRGTLYDFEVGISQAFELGGDRAARRRGATAERDAASQTLAATRNALRAEIRRGFHLALVAQARVGVTTENELAARQFQEAARERLQLGAATQTDVNVAVAGLGRAIAAKKAAERDLLLARQALGDALGIAGDLEPAGTMPAFTAALASEDVLVAESLRTRRDLAAADRIQAARAADVELADAIATPDPEFSVSWARSAIEDSHAVIVGLRVELPLWNRNQGNRSAARALRSRATIEAKAARAGVEREVRTASRRYRSAISAVSAFDQQVVGTLAENLKLARETLAAGKLGLLAVNSVRRDLVESQLTYLDSIAEAVESRAVLERALGRALEGNR